MQWLIAKKRFYEPTTVSYISFMARQPVQVAVYCVRSRGSDWEFLLLHRILDRMSFWQAVTGGVEDDEDYFTAAIRELKEETRFEPISLEMIGYSYVFPAQEEMRKIYEKPVDYITELVFVARIDNDKNPVLDPKEHDKWKWCDYEFAMKLLYWPGNKESLKCIKAFLLEKY